MTVRSDDLVRKPASWMKPPRHRRAKIDPVRVQMLAENIRILGPMNPPECLPDGEVVSGEHRRQAYLLIDEVTDWPVRIVDERDAVNIRIRRLSENIHSVDLSLYDRYEECRGFFDDCPGITQKDIARLLTVDVSTITRIMSLERCGDDVRQAADEVGIKAVYEIAKAPKERQTELLAVARDGGAAAVAEARKAMGGDTPSAAPGRAGKARHGNGTVQSAEGDADKVPTVTVLLPSGKRVVAFGVSTPDEASGLLAKAAKYTKDNKTLDRQRFEKLCRKEADDADARAAIKPAVAAGVDVVTVPFLAEGGSGA